MLLKMNLALSYSNIFLKNVKIFLALISMTILLYELKTRPLFDGIFVCNPLKSRYNISEVFDGRSVQRKGFSHT